MLYLEKLTEATETMRCATRCRTCRGRELSDLNRDFHALAWRHLWWISGATMRNSGGSVVVWRGNSGQEVVDLAGSSSRLAQGLQSSRENERPQETTTGHEKPKHANFSQAANDKEGSHMMTCSAVVCGASR
jgi:hypothetical protein